MAIHSTDNKTPIKPGLDIREASNADIEEIKSLIYEVLAEYRLKPDPQTTDRDLDTIEQSYSQNNGYFGVVEDDGKIIATVAIRRVNDSSCELRKMYTLRTVRGTGMGKQLLEFALQTAQALGYQRIELETASVLREAIGLYRKYGFKQYIPQQYSPRCDLAFELDLSS